VPGFGASNIGAHLSGAGGIGSHSLDYRRMSALLGGNRVRIGLARNIE
jgi:hypothetical protein